MDLHKVHIVEPGGSKIFYFFCKKKQKGLDKQGWDVVMSANPPQREAGIESREFLIWETQAKRYLANNFLRCGVKGSGKGRDSRRSRLSGRKKEGARKKVPRGNLSAPGAG
jgi:hypothetical protein